MEFTQKVARLSTGDIPYQVAGEGAPIVYLHSAGGVRLTQPITELSKSYRLFIPTFPGFDGTPFHAGVSSKTDLASLIAEFIDREVSEQCDVIGHSFGGWVGAWLGVRHSEKLDQLVLECPAGFTPAGKGGLSSDPEILRRQLHAHPERVEPESKPADLVRGNSEARLHYSTPGISFDEALVAELSNIACLTLILSGAKDGVIPAEVGPFLRARIPRSYLVYIHDAAHSVEIDQPKLFLRVVSDFIRWGDGFLVKRSGEMA